MAYNIVKPIIRKQSEVEQVYLGINNQLQKGKITEIKYENRFMWYNECRKNYTSKCFKKTKQFKDYNFATERSQHLMSLGIPLNTDSTLKGQTVFLAERCGELMQDNIITDRTIIDVMAFTQNAKSIPYQDKDKFIDLCKRIY